MNQSDIIAILKKHEQPRLTNKRKSCVCKFGVCEYCYDSVAKAILEKIEKEKKDER